MHKLKFCNVKILWFSGSPSLLRAHGQENWGGLPRSFGPPQRSCGNVWYMGSYHGRLWTGAEECLSNPFSRCTVERVRRSLQTSKLEVCKDMYDSYFRLCGIFVLIFSKLWHHGRGLDEKYTLFLILMKTLIMHPIYVQIWLRLRCMFVTFWMHIPTICIFWIAFMW